MGTKPRPQTDQAIQTVTNTQLVYVPETAVVEAPYADIGSDVYWYVSGSKDVSDASLRHVAVFGGDVVISGSLRVEGCELTGSFNFDCDTLELTGSIEVQGTGHFSDGIFTSEITTLEGNPFFAAGEGIQLISAPDGQITISTSLVWNEKLTNEANGIDVTYSLNNIPSSPTSLMVFVNGVLQEAGENEDFVIDDNVITFSFAPPSGSKITATYSK